MPCTPGIFASEIWPAVSMSGSFATAILVLCLDFCFCLVLFSWICSSISWTCIPNHQPIANIFLCRFLITHLISSDLGSDIGAARHCCTITHSHYSKKTQMLGSFASVILFTQSAFQGPSNLLWPCFRLLKGFGSKTNDDCPTVLTAFQIQIPSFQFFFFNQWFKCNFSCSFPKGKKNDLRNELIKV